MSPGLLLATVLAATPAAPTAQLRVDAAQEMLEVRWCTDAGRALRLRPPPDDAEFRLAVEPAPDHRDDQVWQWDAAPARCVTLRHALGRIADRRREGYGWRAGDTLLAYADTFWWRPEDATATRVHAHLPPGWRLGAPWLPCAGEPDCHHVPHEADPLPALVAFGPFEQRESRIGGTTVAALVVGADDAAAGDALLGVADRATGLLAHSGIALPTPRLQVLVVAWPRAREPIAFGMVNRGGTGGIVLLADPHATPAAQARDWVLPHELAHLLHPYLGSGRGRWLAEGLASYLQNVLRARAGALSRDEAFASLFEGLARGAADGADGPLDAVADARRGLMRTYWGGAAFWLQADLALRARGHPGLAALLDALNRARAGTPVEWTPARFLRRLDAQLRATGHAPWFVEAAREAGAARSFPDRAALAAALGYRLDGARLAPAPAGVDPRASAIMAPPR